MELKNTSTKFDFKDITIVPEKLSFIESRKEVNSRNSNGLLPIMVSPMDTVIDSNNCDTFIKNNLCVCLPRGVNHHSPNIFHSISLDDFENMVNWYSDEFVYDEPTYILVDIANGHMNKLHNLCNEFVKNKKLENHKLMVGNVANPETFKLLCEIGVDYVRVGIGGGCFIDGSKVTTEDGYKDIEKIKIGDRVLTHTGEFREVLGVKRIEYNTELIRINDNITCTPDHRFYVLNRKFIDIVNDENIHNLCEWVSAEDLRENSEYLLIEHKE